MSQHNAAPPEEEANLLPPKPPQTPAKPSTVDPPPKKEPEELKASIWDDLFGGTKTKREKNPKDVQEFTKQVNACIEHMNARLDPTGIENSKAAYVKEKAIPVFDSIEDFRLIDEQNRVLLPPDMRKKDYCYNWLRKIFAFWTSDTVEVYSVVPENESSRFELKQEYRFSELPPLLADQPVHITKNGKFLVVITTLDIRYYLIDHDVAKKRVESPTTFTEPGLVSKIDLGGRSQRMAACKVLFTSYSLNFLGATLQSNQYLLDKFHDPEEMNIVFGSPEGCYLSRFTYFEMPNEIRLIAEEFNIAQDAVLHEFLSGIDKKSDKKVKKLLNLGVAWHVATVEFEETQTIVTSYKLVLGEQRIPEGFQKCKSKTLDVALDPSRFHDVRNNQDYTVLLSKDGKSVYWLNLMDMDNVLCTKLFDLPASVSQVNQIAFTRLSNFNFVLLNCNLGEMHIWAASASHEKAFLQIYKKELPEQHAHLFLPPTLDNIYMFASKSLSRMEFDPFRSNQKMTSFHIPWFANFLHEARIPDEDERICRFFLFDEARALFYVMYDKVFVYNTTKLSHYPQDLDARQISHGIEPSTFKSSEMLQSGTSRIWHFYMSYTEKATRPDSSQVLPAEEHERHPKPLKSHFKVYQAFYDEAAKDYKTEMVIDLVSDTPFDFIYQKHVVMIHQLGTTRGILLRIFTDGMFSQKAVVQHKEFDLFAKFGVTSLQPNPTGPQLSLLNQELAFVIIRPPGDDNPDQDYHEPEKSVALGARGAGVTSGTQPGTKPPNYFSGQTPTLPFQPIPGELHSDIELMFETPEIISMRQANTHSNGVKTSAGYDPEPDNDSMDEHFVKLNAKSGIKYNKRPAAGAYQLFVITELFHTEPHLPLSALSTGKIHASGATFVKASPDCSIVCLYGRQGYEILRFGLKNAYSSYKTCLRMQDQDEKKELLAILSKNPVKDEAEIPSEPNSPGITSVLKQQANNGAIKPQDMQGVLSTEVSILPGKNCYLRTNAAKAYVYDAKVITLRFRWKPRYKISSAQCLEISPSLELPFDEGTRDVNWVAIAFDNNKQYIFEIHSNHSQIVSRRLTDIPYPRKFESLFKFVASDSVTTARRLMLLSYMETPTVGSNTLINIYSTTTKLVLRRLTVKPEMTSMFLDFEVENDLTVSPDKDRAILRHQHLMRSNQEVESGFHIGYLLDESKSAGSDIALGSILFRNLTDYLEAEDPTTESNSLELLKNTFATVSVEEILQDARFCYMAYVLNQPEFFKSALKNIKIEDLISSNYLLELVFSNLSPSRPNSEADIAQMYKDCIQSGRGSPIIPKTWIENLIQKVDLDSLTGTVGSKTLLSSMLLAPTGHKIKGLTRSKDISMIPFPETLVVQESSRKDLIVNKIDCLLLSNPTKSNEYDIYKTVIPLEMTNGSDFSMGFFQMLQTLPDEELRYKYKQIIMYKWRMVYFHSLVYTLIYILLNTMAYLYFGYIGNTWMGIVVLVLNAIFILIDVKMFGSDLLIFSKNLNSWIDIVVHGISAAACIITLFGLVKQENVLLYIKIIAILAVSVRGIIQLKVFSGVRILILLIGRIIVDLLWVPLVLAVIYLLAGSIYILIPLPDGSQNNLSFYEAMRQTFFLLFLPTVDATGDENTNSNGRFIRSFITLVAGSMFVQGIFNFVIAIFLQTFKTVNENRDVYELKSLLIEISDYDLMLKSLSRFVSRPVKYYYLVLVPIPKDGVVFENESRFDRINNIKDSIMVEMGKKSMELMGEQAEKIFQGKKAEIDKLVQLGKDNAKETDPRIRKLVGMLDNYGKTGAKPGMDDLTNIADILSDGLDDQSRATVKNTKDACTKISNIMGSFKAGETPSIEVMLDLVVTMASAVDPQGKNGLVQKINGIKDTVLKILKVASDIKQSGKIDTPVIIQSAVDVAEHLTTGDLKNNLVGIGKAVKVVAEEAGAFSRGQPVNLKRVLEESSQILKDTAIGGLTTDANMKPLIMVASVMTEILKNKDKLVQEGLKNPDLLLEVGGNIVDITFPDSKVKPIITSSRAILQVVDAYKKAAAQNSAAKVSLATSVVPHAAKILESVLPETAETVKVVLGICTAIEKASDSIQQQGRITLVAVTDAVTPLVSQHMGEKGQQAVKAITEVIRLVENEADALYRDSQAAITAAGTLKKLPGLLKSVSLLVKVFAKDNEKQLQQVLDVAIATTQLVQTRLEAADTGTPISENIIEACLMAVDVVALVSPKAKSLSTSLKQGLTIINNQLKNFSGGTDNFDLEVLLRDMEVLVAQHKRVWLPVLMKVSLATREVFVLLRSLENEPNQQPVVLLRLTCGAVTKIVPGISKYTDSIVSLANIGEEVAQSSKEQRSIDVVKVFDEAASIALRFDPALATAIEQSRPVFMTVIGLLRHPLPSDFPSFRTTIQKVAEVVKAIEPLATDAVDVAQNFGIGILGFIETVRSDSVQNANLESLLSPLCDLCGLLDKEMQPTAQKFAKVAVSMQAALVSFSKQPNTTLESVLALVDSLGNVVLEVDQKFAQPVRKMQKLAETIQTAVKEYETPTIDGIYRLVDNVGQLVVECDQNLQVKVTQTLAVLKLIANELQSSSLSTDVVGDQTTNFEALFGIVKTLLTRYNPRLLDPLEKLELLVSGLLLQLSAYQNTGKVDLENGISTAMGIIGQLSPQLSKPSRIIQASLTILVGTAKIVEHGPKLKPSNLDWTKITEAVVNIAQVCEYEDISTITAVGKHIKPILEQLENAAYNKKSSANVVNLIRAIFSCVTDVIPDFSAPAQLAYESFIRLEPIIQNQVMTRKFEPLPIISCAVSILSKSYGNYSVELTAFEALFKETTDLISSATGKRNSSAKDSLASLSRMAQIIRQVVEQHEPVLAKSVGKIQTALDLVFKTAGNLSKRPKLSEVVKISEVMAQTFEIQIPVEFTELYKIVKLFEDQDLMSDSKKFDFRSFGISAAVLIQKALPEEGKQYSILISKLVDLCDRSASVIVKTQQGDFRLSALTDLATAFVRLAHPTFEYPCVQVQTMVELVEAEAGRFSGSKPESLVSLSSRLSKTSQKVLSLFAPDQAAKLDAVVALLTGIETSLSSKGLQLENMGPREIEVLMGEIIKQVAPQYASMDLASVANHVSKIVSLLKGRRE